MQVFLTGASGFLGAVVLKRLKKNNHEVWALARSESSAEKIRQLGGMPVVGELSRIEAIAPVLQGVDAVIHCAAPVEFWGPWEKFNAGIVEATTRLAQLADQAGVKRFIHISSESVLQDQAPLIGIDETEPYPKEPNSSYGKAKMLAEQRLLGADFKMQVLIVRPTFIWGVGTPALDLIAAKARSGQFVWIDSGCSEFEAVHVENAAHAIVRCLEKGVDKGVYIVTDNEPSTVREFFDAFFRSRGIPSPKSSLPGWLARPLAGMIEFVWKQVRIKGNPPLTKFDLAFVSQSRRYKIDRALTELEYRPIISRQEGFARIAHRAETAKTS